MLVTEFGIVTLIRPEQPENAPSPMLVTEFGIVTLIRPEQPENAPSPMLVTEFGMVVFLHPAISVFNTVSTIALQSFLESYFVLPDSTDILSRPEQPKKTFEPRFVVFFGIIMLVRLVQFENA